ncbi:hypothetical protein NC651_006093 [Populus alba x Populus x berolinensis]|uniref:Uncharacterized protein n=3 Tax=Populus TaxID=3689 RepID=A0ACC4CT72_POPAL|nr:uncharacterized protein LOC118035742 isoform X2 [Populus alba]KAG6786485.1 hypothetical protein POTOM_008089 [Populus tomentosa]KAJ6939822.1 hypothetical protein NC651_006093 [Populus alba x Populus x berolinensis]KAJ7007181.1 hypothetical protein NC653_006280 [Populus alba x Populus x berolinensis]
MKTQGTERINEEGEAETKVETVDHRTSAGQGEPTDEKVGVVHLKRNTRDSGSGGGILSSAAAAVTNTFKSAKDAIMGGRGKDNTTK